MLHKRITSAGMMTLLLSATALASCSNTSHSPSSTPKASAGGLHGATITVASDVNFPPFEYEVAHKPIGFDFALLKALAKAGNFKPKLILMDINGIVPTLQSGRAPMAIGALTESPQRKKAVDFSIPYLRTGFAIGVPTSTTSITGTRSLIGKSVAVALGSASDLYLQHLPYASQITIQTYASSAEAYLAVQQHKADATMNEISVLQYDNRKAGRTSLKVASPLIGASYAGIAVAKGHPRLLRVINSALLQVTANGTYSALYKKWLHTTPPFLPHNAATTSPSS